MSVAAGLPPSPFFPSGRLAELGQHNKTEAQLDSCAERLTDLESRAASLATSVEAATDETCPDHGHDDHGLPSGTTRAPGDAHMGVR